MPANQLSKEELERYSRHLIIPEFNIEGQRKLKNAKVLVIGTGGLGSPLLLYLTAAGVGNIGIVDFDVVDDSNLQRQVLYSIKDVGRPKVEAAKERLLALNPYINITTYNTRLTKDNALGIFRNYDLVADGTDNFQTRYLVNDAAVLTGIPNVYASIFRFEGQVSVFNYTNEQGETGPNYRDLFPSPPPPGLVPSCAEGGVIGVLPGIVGSLQANEVIKVLTGIGDPLSGRLFLFDALSFETRTLKVLKNPENPLSGENPTQNGLVDYEEFCGLKTKPKQDKTVKEITVAELSELIRQKADFQLLDVREPHEFEIAEIGGELIPLAQVEENVDRISSDKKVVVHCRSGVRSQKAIEMLEKKFGFTNLYNLKGGILAWADEIDPEMAKY
ncbi:molybdopterin-synthase adenylyltransferase MoeB [Xanthovirga aplysinae]|uniref:molybdopterin-synthase adenylyltransferase MoeB n=1 Tax=Xanthovirga aplysinae TaxID=2529853 RepID=UPI0012BC2D94|nr:molybdopterin-synthase adenylyltransferase MoeB [Xanthovirga aplysinae]MTI30193.1 molybdopterin-synthase adenylyltransferase MoeB [Xanthovirga aplysinae]